ncbi:MAG: site-specific integrase [Firmicutes bacterium]|nr:site-specific integrase [Bacillota bacterium]
MTYKGKTITRHQRGNWYVRVRFNSKVHTIYGRTQIDCYDKLKAVVEQIENNKIIEHAKLLQKFAPPTQEIARVETVPTQKQYTLQEWFGEWLGSYKIGNVRASTINGFKQDFKKLEKLHDLKLGEITNIMLSKAINESSHKSKAGIYNFSSLIKQMFDVAFNNRLIEMNPARNLPKPKHFAKNQKRALTHEQEQKFINLCLADLDKYEPLLICVLQGIRKGEMLALRPNDLCFVKNTLRIDESYDEQNPNDLLTKNQDSNRTMPMFELTRQVLLKYEHYEPTQRIYTKSSAQLSKLLGELLEKNDLPRLTIHELRHTFISRCHEKKIDEIIVQKWVGHAIGSRMTKAVYTHVSSEAELNFIETMNKKTA